MAGSADKFFLPIQQIFSLSFDVCPLTGNGSSWLASQLFVVWMTAPCSVLPNTYVARAISMIPCRIPPPPLTPSSWIFSERRNSVANPIGWPSPELTDLWNIRRKTHILMVPKREIFDRSDFPDFYNMKYLRVGDFGVKIKKNYKYLGVHLGVQSSLRVCSVYF
jgi:hypothetical protein